MAFSTNLQVNIKARISPPLGLRPRFIVRELRIAEIEEAIIRYQDDGRTIPDNWKEELADLMIDQINYRRSQPNEFQK